MHVQFYQSIRSFMHCNIACSHTLKHSKFKYTLCIKNITGKIWQHCISHCRPTLRIWWSPTNYFPWTISRDSLREPVRKSSSLKWTASCHVPKVKSSSSQTKVVNPSDVTCGRTDLATWRRTRMLTQLPTCCCWSHSKLNFILKNHLQTEPAFATLSALSFPGIPTRPGIQQSMTVLPEFVRVLYVLRYL